MIITNTQGGARGINSVAGPITIAPGASAEAEVYERERAHIEATGWFEIIGDYTRDPGSAAMAPAAGERDANGDTPEMQAMRQKFDAVYVEVVDKLQAAEQLIAERDAEIADLRQQLALAGQESPAALRAEHHGGGKFRIMRGDEVLSTGLSKADADAFNGMTEDDKAAFVAKPAS